MATERRARGFHRRLAAATSFPPFVNLTTSLWAAQSMHGAPANEQRARMYDLLLHLAGTRVMGATLDEMEVALDITNRSSSPRRRELHGFGRHEDPHGRGKRPRPQLVEFYPDLKRCTRSGSPAQVCVAFAPAMLLPPVPLAGPPPPRPPPRWVGTPWCETAAGRWMRPWILRRASHRCEGSYRWPECDEYGVTWEPTDRRLPDEDPPRVRRVLTVGHVDQDQNHNAPTNLRAWCARCHFGHDELQHHVNRSSTRARKLAGETPPLPWGSDGG